MALSRAEIVDQQFRDVVAALSERPLRADLDSPVVDDSTLSARGAIGIFESMLSSRHLDLASRALKGGGKSFYTIGSSGHEGNGAVAAALRPDDMAFLHYRSGAFYIERARQVPGVTPLFDVLLGVVASEDEPIAGGRHKVFGSVPLFIPPQTSTIASHLPKAVGAAFFLERGKRLGVPSPVSPDAIVVVSFGDASANHSSAQTAFNAAAMATFQHLPCPVLFVCEDNGIGISVRTPDGWIASRFGASPHVRYFSGDGLDIADTFDVARAAQDYVRTTRHPAFLHIRTVRLLGHAGSDVEQLYRSQEEIEATEAKDPVLGAARMLVAQGWMTPSDVLALDADLRERVGALAAEASRRPKITSRAQVVAPLSPRSDERVARQAAASADTATREAFHGALPEADRPRHLAAQLNRALGDLLLQYPEMVLFGEDVAKKGGVYHVTTELQAKAGAGRVFNTPLDETMILGSAIGAGHMGFLPFPEIQYLAYLHNAEDQLRGEAASLQFFSQGQYRNPMVVRIASLAYQKGFGGHFHNDNSVAVLRDIPGIVIACPSNGEDAVGMLRTLAASAKIDGTVGVFLEPIALYMTKDLHDDKDGLWSFAYPAPGVSVPIGRARVWGDGADLTIVAFGNGTWMSLRVAKRLLSSGIRARVVDLRWLSPLPEDDIAREVAATGKVLVVDETRRSGGLGEALLATIAERTPTAATARVAGVDTFIPLGDAANLVLVQEADIEAAARKLVAS